jgi:NMD protein affecting ribosome stability and mRNA decay
MRRSLPAPAPSERKKEQARPDRPGIELCRGCGAVFWEKRWRQNLDAIDRIPKDFRITYVRCPACAQAAAGVFEGELEVTGIPADRFGEVVRTIRAMAERARERDPMDRLLSFEAMPALGRVRVTLSENQLAKRLGRKLKEAYGAKVAVTFSEEESTIRVKAVFR